MSITVEIVGLTETRSLMVAGEADMMARVAAGMIEWGHLIEYAAKANLAPHHYHGTAEQQVMTVGPVVTETTVEVFVGIHGGLAPEGRPLEFGWASTSGKQPPTAAIAEWLTSKPGLIPSRNVTRNSSGFIRRRGTIASISGEAAVRSMAFVIARNIGRRGYSFGSLSWLSRALAETSSAGLAALERAMSA